MGLDNVYKYLDRFKSKAIPFLLLAILQLEKPVIIKSPNGLLERLQLVMVQFGAIATHASVKKVVTCSR
jgi:hypothetical protein